MSWLTDYVNQHSEFEAPISFYFWGGLASISAVIKDNVWIDRHIYKLYGNIYVMYHAESGLKKGPPINSSRRLVTEAIGSQNIITGRSSIQGILKEMGQSKTAENGKVIHNTASFICSSELTSSLVDDPVATQILTDLYDRNYNEGHWKSLLKMETFSIKSPCISMLCATNEAMSSDFFTNSAVKGGYFARTFIIYERVRNRINSLQVPPKDPINYTESAKYLKKLSTLKGPFKPTASRVHTHEFPHGRFDESAKETFYFNDAGMVYENWYQEFVKVIDSQEMKDETGTMNRFGDSVLKVAMLMSLAEHECLEIKEETMFDAIKACEKLLSNVKKVTLGKNGTSATAVLKSMIIFELLGREPHQISKQLLMKKYMYHYGSEDEFNEIMNSIVSAGTLNIKNMGQTVIYEMPDREVQLHMKLMEGKFKQRGKL